MTIYEKKLEKGGQTHRFLASAHILYVGSNKLRNTEL